MVLLAGAQAIAERVGKSDFVIVDPRRPMKYLSGHLNGAVNLPVYRAFGDNGSLLEAGALAEWLGAGGVGEGVTPVLYDSPQGQNAAMLAWIMEYLGAPEIFLLDVFFERSDCWKILVVSDRQLLPGAPLRGDIPYGVPTRQPLQDLTVVLADHILCVPVPAKRAD